MCLAVYCVVLQEICMYVNVFCESHKIHINVKFSPSKVLLVLHFAVTVRPSFDLSWLEVQTNLVIPTCKGKVLKKFMSFVSLINIYVEQITNSCYSIMQITNSCYSIMQITNECHIPHM